MQAAFELFGESGESAVTVRSVCRRGGLNTRYFYESFRDTDELLGATYDSLVADLIDHVAVAAKDFPDDRSRLGAGIRAVLDYSAQDPRRGRLLFTESRTNPVLAERRSQTQELLRKSVIDDLEGAPSTRTLDLVNAAMYAGAMAGLAQEWLLGNLGDDLDPVVRAAVRLLMPDAG